MGNALMSHKKVPQRKGLKKGCFWGDPLQFQPLQPLPLPPPLSNNEQQICMYMLWGACTFYEPLDNLQQAANGGLLYDPKCPWNAQKVQTA